LSYGFAKSSDAAESEARKSLSAGIGDADVVQWATNLARSTYRGVCLKSRAERTSNATDTCQPEFVYHDWDSDYGPSGSSAYRIVKKTATRVYIEWQQDVCVFEGREYCDVTTFVLDRQKLEDEGYAYSRHRGCFFYTTPYDVRHRSEKVDQPKCFQLLGISRPCTVEEVNRAYRKLALETHPDHGGSADAFKLVQDAFERALAMVS
jgi:hypothetical protein